MLNRIRQRLNDRWLIFLPGVFLVILFACFTFVRQAGAVRTTQAAGGSQGGCGSGQVECKLAEVGRLSTALFAVRQRIEKAYGKDAAIQYKPPEAVGTGVQVQVVVDGKVRKTFLVDEAGNVRERSSRPLPLEKGKPSERKETKP